MASQSGFRVSKDRYNEVMARPVGGLPGVHPRLVGLYCTIDDSPLNVAREVNFRVPFWSTVLQFPHYRGVVLGRCIISLSADSIGSALRVFGYYCWQDEAGTPKNCNFGDLLVVTQDSLSNGTRAKLTIQWADIDAVRPLASDVLSHIIQCWPDARPQLVAPMQTLGLVQPALAPVQLSPDESAPDPAEPEQAEGYEPGQRRVRRGHIANPDVELPKTYWELADKNGERPTLMDLADKWMVHERTIQRAVNKIIGKGLPWPPLPPSDP